jgi:hypothetical protein
VSIAYSTQLVCSSHDKNKLVFSCDGDRSVPLSTICCSSMFSSATVRVGEGCVGIRCVLEVAIVEDEMVVEDTLVLGEGKVWRCCI